MANKMSVGLPGDCLRMWPLIIRRFLPIPGNAVSKKRLIKGKVTGYAPFNRGGLICRKIMPGTITMQPILVAIIITIGVH